VSYQDSRRAYLARLARALPPSFVEQALAGENHLTGEVPQYEQGTAMQIEFRYRQGSWRQGDGFSAAAIATMPIAKLCRQLLEDAFAPWHGEVIAFGSNRISVAFRGEQQVERACQSALHAQRCLVAMQTSDPRFQIDLAISIASGEMWLPMVGDPRQKIIAFGGPACRLAATMQDLVEPAEIVVDEATIEALGERATLRENAFGAKRLVELQVDLQRQEPNDEPPLDLESIQDVDQAIARLEAFVVPPLSQRLRYVPDEWRTSSELRNAVAVMCEVKGLEHGQFEAVRALAEVFIAGHREYGGLIMGVEALSTGHRTRTLYGLHAPSENDPERAVMASMRITRAVEAIAAERNIHIEIRTTVHEGEIYFDAFGSEARYGVSVAGTPILLTEELIDRAKPGQVLVTDVVAAKLTSNFKTSQQGEPLILDDKPLGLHVVDEVTYGASRYMQARDANRDVAGRGTTLRELESLTDDAIEGHGGIYSLCGEAGTGKTFLLAPIVDRWMAAGGLGVIGHCRYATQSIPLAPITSMLLNLAEVESSDLDQRNKEDLKRVLKNYCQTEHLDDLVGLLFASPTELGEEGPPAELDERWERIMLAIEEIVAQRIKQQPILYVMEDLQFADSMTLRVAQRLATIARDRSFMIVCTYRPRERLKDLRELVDREFELTNLGLRELRDATSAFFGVPKVDEQVGIMLWERTSGNPGQLYELLGYLRDRGLLVTRAQQVCLAEHSEDGFAELLPPNMSQQALVRLNQISPVERRVVHLAAIVGRVIPKRVIEAFELADWKSAVEPALTHLIDEGILAPEISSTPSYRFRDDTARVVAYSSIPPKGRRNIHARVADVIERMYAGDHDRNAHTLALHRDRAGQTMMAIHWYERASRATSIAMLDRETVSLVNRWHALVEELKEEERPPKSTFSQMAVRRFVATARHFGAEDALDQARVIADEYRSVMNQHEKAVCDLWHGAALQSSGQTQSAKARLSRAYESDTYSAVRCDAAIRMSKCLGSDIEGASRWLTRAAALVSKPDSYWADRVDLARACLAVKDDRLDDARIINAQVRDRAHRAGRIRLAAIATSNLADCDMHCGDVEDARRGFAEARVMSRCLGTRSDAAIDELNLGMAELYAGNASVATTHLGYAVAISNEIGFKAIEFESRVHFGAATAMQGQLDEGERLCKEAREMASEADFDFLEPVANLHLLHIAILRKDKDSAASLLRRCQKADPGQMSPLLRDQLSKLRSMGRPLLRD
jgi:class 3 adenylate cyclase